MAWSWSHTQEAYDNARANLADLEFDQLCEAAAQWAIVDIARKRDPDIYAWEVDYSKLEWHKKRYLRKPREEVENFVWDKMEDAATCDNGGWNAWVDPEGYIQVSFSRDKED